MNLKICGMKHADNLSAVADLAPDYLGFIFYEKSPRYFVDSLPPETVRALSPTIQRVGVFVNASTDYVQEMAERYGLHALQLHGQEPPEQCKVLRLMGYKIFKVFSVHEAFDFNQLTAYQPHVDAFLFDTATPQHGGSGVAFDWSILVDYQLPVPFFLSGGIGLDNLDQAMQINHPQLLGLDVNSRFETAPGRKSIHQLQQLIARLGQ
ncbi:MAG: phosphoribosylanthranilate isomerase [Tunicatimonas sp.]